MGLAVNPIQAPDGAAENQPTETFFRPIQGLIRFVHLTHGSRRGLLSAVAPRLGALCPVRPPQTAIGSLQTATMAHGHQLGLCRGARPSRLAVSGVAPLLPATPKMKGRRSSSSALPKPTGKAKTSRLYQMPGVAIED